jgi:hypothetical protein
VKATTPRHCDKKLRLLAARSDRLQPPAGPHLRSRRVASWFSARRWWFSSAWPLSWGCAVAFLGLRCAVADPAASGL